MILRVVNLPTPPLGCPRKLGSMASKWVISPTYWCGILGWNNSLILTIDPNFLAHPSSQPTPPPNEVVPPYQWVSLQVQSCPWCSSLFSPSLFPALTEPWHIDISIYGDGWGVGRFISPLFVENKASLIVKGKSCNKSVVKLINHCHVLCYLLKRARSTLIWLN